MFRKIKTKKRKSLRLVLIPIAFASLCLTAVASTPTSNTETPNPIAFTPTGNTAISYQSAYDFGGNTFALQSAYNDSQLVEVNKSLAEAVAAMSTSCADPDNPSGLGSVQAKQIEERRKIDIVDVNLDKIFEIGKEGGCFDALMYFPDLSIQIPTLSGIFSSIKNTLVNYAIKKVCTAVNEVIEDVVGPVKEAMEKIEDDLDLSGNANRKIREKLGDIDPELHRIHKSPKPGAEYDFKW